jgi:hypothetical protein
MRPVTVRLSAAGRSSWIPVDRYVPSFIVGLGVKLSSNGNLTYSVEHTFDDVFNAVAPVAITRVTTTATVNFINHGMSAGDYLKVIGSGDPNLDGEYAIAAITDQNNFTYTVVDTGLTAAVASVRIVKCRIFAHEILAAKTASDDGNYVAPISACRLNVTAFTAGYVDLTAMQGGIQ